MKDRSAHGRRAQRGVGLIEVLISVLVLSFGMLGLAGLQLWSLRNNQSSMERSLAVVQTHSIVDAMRADRSNAIAGNFNTDATESESEGSTFALESLANWRESLIDALGPGATGDVLCDEELCTITVRWNDERAAAALEGSTDTQLEITTQVRL
ncbi:type IV pilus modification protein PilV [Steroidobacter sp. S1-65]|uniref:Type IV pilus modification protein PilV n=1 Tax=Steroidobacter gossypii TaxID=2805490 RepID=A0ABS1X1N0_9GAMM|nr:type IV pilus modification protein PilV [Steroidobacter gossypii]MBM0107147.1 type IV pilus modification protein PilV [Steroidobacter gossypii]